MAKLLISSDLHLSIQEKEYSLSVLDEIIKHAENYDALLLLGDTFNTFEDLRELKDIFSQKLENYKKNVLLLKGNHENLKSKGITLDKLKFPNNVIVIENISFFNVDNLDIIALPYNDYAFTVDAFNRQGNIDGKGNSYAAELVPSPIVSEGVEFDVLNDVTRKNVVRCNGQRIALPEGNYDRLYLLVASLTEDQEAEFAIDGRAFRCMVPYYTGFFGQWGHDGETGYVKDGVLAYVGTHRHSATRGNDPYVFTYMYKVSLPVNGPVHDLQLPDNKDIVVFAATAVDDSNDDLVPLCEVRALP